MPVHLDRSLRVAEGPAPVADGLHHPSDPLCRNRNFGAAQALAMGDRHRHASGGRLPAIFKALDLDRDLASITRFGNAFKSLQDRFRQARTITSSGGPDEFKREFAALRSKLDDARMASIPPPERYFKRARAKIRKGHYTFEADGAPQPSKGAA